MSDELSKAIVAIQLKRIGTPLWKAILIGITGIDGCGKGYLTRKFVSELRKQGCKAVDINADDWLNLPDKRFSPTNPAKHFYENAIRFEDMFDQLVLPLKQQRRHRLVADVAEETANEYRKQTYEFEEVDVVILEGIYLLKRNHRSHFDLAFWVDCSFETALERALQRGQEGLSAADTLRAYETTYFPAQRIHFAQDNPQAAADLVIRNDPRLTGLESTVSGAKAAQSRISKNLADGNSERDAEGARSR